MDYTTDIARCVFDAYNAHDLKALRILYDSDASTRRPGWPTEVGVEDLLAAAQMDAVAFPDLCIAPIVSATEGSRILTDVRISGTNRG